MKMNAANTRRIDDADLEEILDYLPSGVIQKSRKGKRVQKFSTGNSLNTHVCWKNSSKTHRRETIRKPAFFEDDVTFGDEN